MRGYPKWLNNKADYEYVRANFSKAQWSKDFQKLLDTRVEWFNVGEVIKGDGVTDGTHKVVKDEQTGKLYQYELRDNPNAKIYRIGYTVDEVTAILAADEVADK